MYSGPDIKLSGSEPVLTIILEIDAVPDIELQDILREYGRIVGSETMDRDVTGTVPHVTHDLFRRPAKLKKPIASLELTHLRLIEWMIRGIEINDIQCDVEIPQGILLRIVDIGTGENGPSDLADEPVIGVDLEDTMLHTLQELIRFLAFHTYVLSVAGHENITASIFAELII